MNHLVAGKVTFLLASILLAATMTQAKDLKFDTSFAELDASKMITTGDSNYAILHNNFPANWRSVSVNGDEVTVATRDNQVIVKRYSALTSDEKNSIESIKGTLMSLVRLGPYNVKSQTGFAKLTTFDRYGGSSSMSSGGGGSSSSSSSSSSSASSSGGISIQRTSPNSFIVAKSDFQFNWLRVFVNEDVVTIVYHDGRVSMLPQEIMRPDEKASLIALRKEVDKSSKETAKITSSIANTLKNPMDFVNRAFGGMFG